MEVNKIIQADLFDGLLTLENNSIDLVVTSPPYFDARNYNGNGEFKQHDDWFRFCHNTLSLLQDKIKDTGVIWWNTGSGYRDNKKLTTVYRLVLSAEAMGLFLIDEIPWIKKSAPPKHFKNRPYPAWEHNYIFAKDPSKVTFYRDNVRRPYAESTKSRVKYKMGILQQDKNGDLPDKETRMELNEGGATPPNYLILSQDVTRRPHPAPMNPQLAEWAIKAYSKEGDVVLDPMMGAGTVAVEAERLGRNWLGFDLDASYIEMAYHSIELLRDNKDPYKSLKEWKNGRESDISFDLYREIV